MATNMLNSRGFHESDLDLCTAQSLPVDGAADVSENSVNLGIAAIGRFPAGAKIKIQCTTAFGVQSGTPTIDVYVITDADSALGSATTIGKGLVLTSDVAKGEVFTFSVPEYPDADYEKYLGISLNPSTSDFTAGAIDAWVDFD